MTNELDHQQGLKLLLEENYKILNIPIQLYCQNEFKRIDAHWAKKPDLLIIGTKDIYHETIKEKKCLCSPIGIEFKEDGIGVTKFTRTIFDQVREGYFDGEYVLKDKKEEKFKINSWAYTTTNLIKNGQLLRTPYCECNTLSAFNTDLMWAERVCWAANMAILLNFKHKLTWSYKNWYFDLKGMGVARYGKDAKLFEY